MTREAFEIELNKLDLLHQKYTEAYETLLAHVRSGELNFLEWDDKTYKAAEAAWHTQLKKVYPDQCEYEDCDQIQDRLETMAVEFTCEQEVPDEPDDLVEAFSAAEERWHQITDENRMKENLELIAREHFKEGTSTRFEGNYIVSIYRYGKMVIGFPADAYEIDSDIPLKEMIELRVKPTWSSCLRKETISTGNSAILVDAKTQEIVFQLNSNEETLLVDSFGQTDSNAGRACFVDRVRCQFASLVSVDEYRIAMCLKYATMYSQGRMPDEVYWHTLHEITTLYVLGRISQYGYIFLKKQSQKLRNKAREEWENMATSKRWEAMKTPLTEKEKWIR